MREFQLQEENLRGYGEKIGPNIWVHINGKTFIYLPEKMMLNRPSTDSAQAKKQIVSPMPGKVISLKVKANDTVKKDQVLIVIEAMKMEYTLKSELDGVVNDVNCKVGQQVNLGDVLIRIM